MFALKFRPSSHSEESVIVVTYRTTKEAKRAQVSTSLKRVANQLFAVVSDGSPEYTNEVMEKTKRFNPEKTEDFCEYQLLLATVELPKKITKEMTVLLFSRAEQKIIEFLKKHCKDVEIEQKPTSDTYIFRYAGDKIFFPPGVFHINGDVLYPRKIKVKTFVSMP